MSGLNRILFTLQLQMRFFTQVTLGKKVIEGRIFTPKYASLAVGSIIRMTEAERASHFVDVHVTRLTRYSSFRNMLKNEGIENCLPGVDCIEEGVKIYHSFPDYQVNEAKYGVLAIGIKVSAMTSMITPNL